MDEQGFDFGPKERREPKPFEPPPWERDAFERLERERAALEAAHRAEEGSAIVPSAETGAVEPVQPSEESEPAEAQIRASAAEKQGLNEAEVIEMLSALAEEEPARPKGYFAIGFGAGMVLLAIGGVLIVWAMAALVGARQTGAVGQWTGVGLGMFGAFFMAMGVWMVYRTLKQRGVL